MCMYMEMSEMELGYEHVNVCIYVHRWASWTKNSGQIPGLDIILDGHMSGDLYVLKLSGVSARRSYIREYLVFCAATPSLTHSVKHIPPLCILVIPSL